MLILIQKLYEDFIFIKIQIFGTTTTIHQTIFIKDGEVVLNKSGILKYVDFSDMVKEWKNL